ncbi:MAG TPA: hypothetical protein VJ841_03920 [Candidatus Saccharimonadales bacterium]|nr:hypothetical protein [Candidatus Saccharimonadales bacterium]
MAMFIRQNDPRSKLQERIEAQLREKAKNQGEGSSAELPDGVDDSQYLHDTKRTTSLAWLWIVIVVFAVAALIVYMIGSSS